MQKKNLFGILILIAYSLPVIKYIKPTMRMDGITSYHSKKTVLLKSLL